MTDKKSQMNDILNTAKDELMNLRYEAPRIFVTPQGDGRLEFWWPYDPELRPDDRIIGNLVLTWIEDKITYTYEDRFYHTWLFGTKELSLDHVVNMSLKILTREYESPAARLRRFKHEIASEKTFL